MTVENDADGGGGGFAFRVRPNVLRDYATTVRLQSEALGEIEATLASSGVESAWFGKLPESGHLADRYEAHHEAELAGLTELVTVLAAIAVALEATAGVYAGVDTAAADALGAVQSADRGVGGGSGVPNPARTGLAEALR